MPIDPSIPLQVQQPNSVNLIGSFLDLGRKKLELDKSRETYAADVAQRKAESSSSQSAATVNEANVQPLIQQQAANTQTAQAQAGLAKFRLSGEQAQKATEIANGLVADPDFVQGNTDGMLDKLNRTQVALTQQFGVDPKIADAIVTSLKYQALHTPTQVQQSLKNMIIGAQSAGSQAGAVNPNTAFIQTAGGIQPYNTNSFAPGGIGPQGQPMAPPNQVITNPNTGGLGRVNPATGAGFNDTAPPPGETIETGKRYTDERNAARAAANAAPTLHNINQSIVQELDKGTKTGTLAQVAQKLASATGFQLPAAWGGDQAADYNTLGKMLERSALTAAQGMGPHTNAGLEAQVRANGSLDYSPQALRKIASLNDALVTGATLYSSGLEGAMTQQGQYSKPAFDKAWASAMNPSNGVDGVQALRLKNAVDNQDTKEIQALIKEVGGPGSKGATALRAKLAELQRLSGQ